MTKTYNTSIRFSGKNSFHVICGFGSERNIDSIRLGLENHLKSIGLNKDYTIGYKRTRGIPNLDLSPNKLRGGFITLHSLSTIGLKCMEVDPGRIIRFRKELARI